MRKQKNKMLNLSKGIKGKFFTVEHKQRNKVQRYCAKLVNETEKFITVFDVNSGETIKMGKSAIASVHCGSFNA